MTRRSFLAGLAVVATVLGGAGLLQAQAAPGAGNAGAPGLLTREQVGAILPASVFFRGQSATVQVRNSGGIRLPGGKLVLTALVDTGGYSTAVQQTYQAYLITEVSLKLGDKTLAPGAYGFGFVAGDRMVVMDLGANELLSTATMRDAEMARPTPLKLVADGSNAGRYRLYLGRSWVSVAPEEK